MADYQPAPGSLVPVYSGLTGHDVQFFTPVDPANVVVDGVEVAITPGHVVRADAPVYLAYPGLFTPLLVTAGPAGPP